MGLSDKCQATPFILAQNNPKFLLKIRLMAKSHLHNKKNQR